MKDIKAIKKHWDALKKSAHKTTDTRCSYFMFFAKRRQATAMVWNEDLKRFLDSDIIRDFVASNEATVETYPHNTYETIASTVRFSF